MSRRAAMGTAATILTVIIIAGAIGVLVVAVQAGTSSTTAQSSPTSSMTQTSVFTITTESPVSTATSGSVTTATCYGGTLPTNSSGSTAQTYSRTVFNITKEFDSWSWTSLSTFEVGSYTFITTNPATTSGVSQLEPQLFFNVTNSQGQVQRTSFTNLGGWNGQVWPPDMGLQATLFGGEVTIQWLFLCDSHDVFLAVTTESTTLTNKNQISLRNFYLQVNGSAPGYPGTLLAGEIYVNASVPWSSYTLYTNNTFCSTRTFPNSTLTQFIYQFKGRPCIPVKTGNTYLIKFVVSFTDGANATSTTSVTAE